jgi:hypothetical protein
MLYGGYSQPGMPLDLDRLCQPHPYNAQQQSDSALVFKLVCDSHVCECRSSAVETVGFLFKFIWGFQLEYPEGLNQFFEFLQFWIYTLTYAKKRASPTVSEIG